jgi:leucyl aminopeptidase
MPTPGFVPVGDEFYASIRRPGLEEIIEDDAGRKMKFPSAASAVIHARRVLRAIDIARNVVSMPMPTLHAKWKLEKAEDLRREREAFDMRNVTVVSKKRRFGR